jgi:hypothetical protein
MWATFRFHRGKETNPGYNKRKESLSLIVEESCQRVLVNKGRHFLDYINYTIWNSMINKIAICVVESRTDGDE